LIKKLIFFNVFKLLFIYFRQMNEKRKDKLFLKLFSGLKRFTDKRL